MVSCLKLHSSPSRRSWTVRLPLLMPISVRSLPSNPVTSSDLPSRPSPPRPSIQASSGRKVRREAALRDRLQREPGRRRLGSAAGSGRPARCVTQRTLAAGEDVDAAILLDVDHKVGVDQAEALGARIAHQQAGAGDADLGLRRGRHHRAAGVAHHDVAQPQRRAPLLVAFELRAADLDAVAAAEVLLDRGGQPRRRDIERDRAAGQPPPQRTADDESATANRAGNADGRPGAPPDGAGRT